MILLFYGTDGKKAREKTREEISRLKKKNPESESVRITSENLSVSKIDEYIKSRDLFGGKKIIFLDHIFEEETGKEVSEKISDMKNSENIFVILEKKINKEIKERILKNAEKSEDFSIKETEEKRDGSLFKITDALGKKDKKNLWILFRKAIDSGVPAEEIHGIIFWQIKSMILAKKSKNAKEAGMKDFPFTKSKSFLSKYKEGELEKMSSLLVQMYHEAHRGKYGLETALEKFILGL